ncbi:MAG: NrfD/PsrC family molybdoenzyme membrane anchor subunit [Vulcanimicrobiaceae bacterium]
MMIDAQTRPQDAPPSLAPTYYERPLLKGPHWEWNVVTYLFLGGITGGLGLIALLAGDSPQERRLRRTARYASLALAAASPAVLMTHLGRPERFLNMLRIVKFKSPMSLGVWGLVLYSGVAAGNVVRQLADDGRLPSGVRMLFPGLLTPVQAMLGVFIAGYTGVLLGATAIPLWGKGKIHIPAAFVCSGVAGACALTTLLSTLEGNHRVVRKLERLELVASLAELGIVLHFRVSAAELGRPMFDGARGERLERHTLREGIGWSLALTLFGRLPLPKSVDALRSIGASILTLIGGYVLRETLIEAGKASVLDPRAASIQPR